VKSIAGRTIISTITTNPNRHHRRAITTQYPPNLAIAPDEIARPRLLSSFVTAPGRCLGNIKPGPRPAATI
jgi:hypothetical protein